MRAVIGVLTAVTGCSYLGTARDFDPADFSRDPRWLRAGDVPLILQRSRKDCGAAAAAMVLAHWNRPVTLDEVSAGVAPDRGLTAADLKKLFLDRRLKSRVVPGTVALLGEQLARGRPVIVGLVKPAITGAMTHFEVVVAWHPVDNRVVTLDPARGWRENDLEGFLREWDAAGRTLVAAYEM